jgi:pyruvate dehydrogenase E1 component alpha subunit
MPLDGMGGRDTTFDGHDEAGLIALYRRLRLIREFENAVDEVAAERETAESIDDLATVEEGIGAVHLCRGQEAVATGVGFALGEDDVVVGTHRSHGQALGAGSDPDAVLAEICGKTTGVSGGRGGEMNLFDPESGVFETTGMIGHNTPHAAGRMLAAEMDGEDRVGVCYVGDGAMNQGVVAESMNLAAIWDLPVVFVCENNQYAVSTSVEYATAGEIPARAEAFGIPAASADGQDVLAVYELASERVEAARREGPQFVEFETYRYDGHFSWEESGGYRPEAEVRHWRENHDPVARYRERLRTAGGVDTARLDEIDAAVSARVERAVDRMRRADLPEAERSLEGMYADEEYQNLPAPKYR